MIGQFVKEFEDVHISLLEVLSLKDAIKAIKCALAYLRPDFIELRLINFL